MSSERRRPCISSGPIALTACTAERTPAAAPRKLNVAKRSCMPPMAPPGGGRHALICRRPRCGSVAGETTRCEICPPVLHAMSCRGPSWREPARDRAAVSHVASQVSCCRPAAAPGGWCASDHAEVPTQCRPGRGCHGLFEDAAALNAILQRRSRFLVNGRIKRRGGEGCRRGTGPRRRSLGRGRQKRHAGGVVADIRRRAPRRKAGGGELLHHLGLAVAGEAKV